MSVEPEGIISRPFWQMREVLVRSPEWQRWCGVTDPVAARDHVAFTEYDGALSGVNPLCVISPADEGIVERSVGVGSLVRTYWSTRRWEFRVWALVPAAEQASAADAFFGFTNRLGVVIEEMQAVGRQQDAPEVQQLRVVGIMRGHSDQDVTVGDYMMALLMVEA